MKGLLGIIFFITMGSSIINPLVGPLIFSEQGFLANDDSSQKIQAYSLIIGIYALGMIIGNPVWGFIASKTRKKTALMVALMGTILSYVLCIMGIVLVFFAFFVLGRLLDGLMSGRRVIAISMLLGAVEDKIKSFQLSEMANAVGLFLGPLCSGLMIGFFTPRTPLYYYALPFLVMLFAIAANLIWVCFFVSNTKKIVTTSPQPKVAGSWLLYGRFFIFQLGWYLYFLAITPYLIMHWHFSALALGIFFSGMVAVYFFFLLLLLLLKKHIRMELLSSCSFYLLIITLSFLSYFNQSFPAFLIGNGLIAFGIACNLPVLMATILSQHQEQEQTTVIGIQNGLIGLAWLTAASILSCFSSIPLNVIFLLAAVCLALFPLLGWLGKRGVSSI